MKLYKILFLGFLVFLLSSHNCVMGQNLGEWTGVHSRLVWVQDQGNGGDTFAQGKNLLLYGYDSKDGKGERVLSKKMGNVFKPIFTADGQNVIFSDRKKRQIYLLNWETGKIDKLRSGVAVAVWQDTKASFFLRKKTTWVYCFDGLQPENRYGTSQPLYRFPLDNPKKKELIWNKTNMAWSNVQLSRDGEVVGGLFPWPDGGVLRGDKKKFVRYGRGCWTSLSPDNSKLLWIFDGLHRNIQIHDLNNNNSWKVNINSAPGIKGYEVYHPRWSNHPRYFVMTGPYEKGEGGNKITGGGDNVEVYVGCFDSKAKNVEDWIQVTTNKRADFYPDLWVEGGEKHNLFDQDSTEITIVDSLVWPQSRDNLLYVWEDMKASNQLAETSPIGFYQCNLTLRGNALFNRDLTFNASGGWGDTGDAGDKIAKALAETGQATIEILVTPVMSQKGVVLSLQGRDGESLSIHQDGGSLVVENSSVEKRIERISWDGVFAAQKATHLLLSLTDGQVEVFKDANSLGMQKLSVDFSSSGKSQLILGDQEGGWQGSLANVALYQAPLAPQQLKKNSEYALQKIKARKSVERLVVEGRLLETTEIPAPDAIGAYRRALVVNSYEVEKVIEGEYKEKKIVIAEWAVLDRKIIKKYSEDIKIERLVLERFEDHPELEGERQMMDIFEPDLSTYYRLN